MPSKPGTKYRFTVPKSFAELVVSLRTWAQYYEESYLLLMATIVGLGMGLAVTVFRLLIIISHKFFQGQSDAIEASASNFHWHWGLLINLMMPAIGGLIVGLLIYRVMSLRGGHGVPSVMKAVATGQVNLPPSMAIKSAISPITITTGGSAGPEGPIVEIGAVVGSLIGTRGHARKDQVATLVGCGSAAGIAAVFGAPMGGVVFALELIMRDLHVRKFAPVVVAAVVASVTSSALLASEPAFMRLPPGVLDTIQPSGFLILQFGVLGIACAGAGALLISAMYWMHDLFQLVKVPMWLKPAIGGLAVGAIGIVAPGVLGEGYEVVNELLLEHPIGGNAFGVFVATLVALCVLKIFATALTLGSGSTGGSFAPAMVAGAFIGGAVGVLADQLMPTSSPDPRIFALVGMAGVVSSAIGTRLGAMLIIYEVSGGNYNLVLPLMITVAISSIITTRVKKGSVYTLSLLRDGFDVEENLERRDPLASIPISEVMTTDFISLRPQDPLPRIMELLGETDVDAFLVTNERGELRGVISTSDLRSVINLGVVGEAAFIAQDVADTYAPALYPDSPASKAVEIFASSDTEGIPILESPANRKVVAIVYRGAVLKAYRHAARAK